MGLIDLTIVNLKRFLKNHLVLVMTFLLPLVTLIGINYEESKVEKPDIIIVDKDQSNKSEELIDKIKKIANVEIKKGNSKKYYDKVEKEDYLAIYEISKGFESNIKDSKYSTIKRYAIKDSTSLQLINDTIDNYIKTQVLDNQGIKYNYKSETEITDINEEKDMSLMNILMLCYFMSICSSSISQDIIKMKQQNILKRSLTTANSDRKILGGIFLSVFILEMIAYNIIMVITKYCLNVPGINLGLSILAITLSAFVTTAMIIFFTRYIKNPSISSFVIAGLGIAFFILAMCNSVIGQFENVPSLLSIISVFSPLYWVANIINGTKVIFSSIIIILMTLAFFTAGSFRLREYVKN